MKLTLAAENIQKKLHLVNKAVSSRSQLPILLNFLLETRGNTLHMSATDLEIGIEGEIPATVEEEGKITVPARTFAELIASLPAGTLTLQTTDTTLEVRSKKTKTVFPTMPAEEFPALYEEKGEQIAVIAAKALFAQCNSVIFAASADTTRPALSGVLLKKYEQTFLLVATDGYRLSLHGTGMQERVAEEKEEQFLIPARILKEVVATKQEEKEITLFVSRKHNQVLFYEDSIRIVGRLIDAQFPNYQKIIPTDTNTTVTFDKEELQKAVKLCAIFARESANIVKFQIKKDMLIVSANTSAVGENTVEVEVTTTGEENEIAFNAKYLLDLFANMQDRDMLFEMTGPLNPGVFKRKGDDSFLHIIMPIRVQG